MATITEVGRSVRSYGRLSNVYFLDYNLGYLLIATLFPAAIAQDPRTWISLTFFFAGYFLVHCAMVAFDDITGFRDGTDATNYRANPSALRRAHWKPLVTGELDLDRAIRFSWGSTSAGIALLIVGLLIAPHHPTWLIVLTIAGACISVQYSYGLKLSHIGFQEIVLLLWTMELVLIPFFALTGGIDSRIAIEASLFAFWLMMVSLYSNLRDCKTDRSAGRVNLATVTSERTYIAILGVLAVVDIVAVVSLTLIEILPPLYLILLCPVFLLRLLQFRVGALDRDPLRGRWLGRRLAWTGAILMAVGNLLV